MPDHIPNDVLVIGSLRETFIGEIIRPLKGSIEFGGAAPGEPGVPGKFVWRKKTYQVGAVLKKWRDTGACTHQSGERYVRKHWFEIETTGGERMTLYFERRPRKGAVKRHWCLYTGPGLEE